MVNIKSRIFSPFIIPTIRHGNEVIIRKLCNVDHTSMTSKGKQTFLQMRVGGSIKTQLS